MPAPETYQYEQLATLLQGPEGVCIRRFDHDMRSREPSSITIVLTSRSSRMINVGPLITTTDRELRRAVAIFGLSSSYGFYDYDFGEEGYYYLGDSPGDHPRPIPANYGGLELADAISGSFHMLVTAYGYVLSLLASKPLQALTAVVTLGQGIGNIHVWSHRKKDPLTGISARQALDVIKSFGGDTTALMRGDEPNLQIEIQPASDETGSIVHREPPYEAPPAMPTIGDEINRFGESVTRGRRITYIRNYPDGAQDIIYIDDL
jgi:hypothetical protein